MFLLFFGIIGRERERIVGGGNKHEKINYLVKLHQCKFVYDKVSKWC
jgi:hypothetical protein